MYGVKDSVKHGLSWASGWQLPWPRSGEGCIVRCLLPRNISFPIYFLLLFRANEPFVSPPSHVNST